MKFRRLQLAGAALILSACGDGGPVETVEPATGEALVSYSENITDRADRRKDASLYEYFCHNALDAACPADIVEQLEAYTVSGGISRVHLADAFVRLKASRDMGDPDGVISDEAYVVAAYQVVLGRDPEPSGRADHLDFLRTTGARQTAIQAMLQSTEFRSR